MLRADAEILDVHDQLDHVLLDTGDRGEFVQHAVDLDARDGGAGIELSRVRRSELPSV
jgi:hypothetical protein